MLMQFDRRTCRCKCFGSIQLIHQGDLQVCVDVSDAAGDAGDLGGAADDRHSQAAAAQPPLVWHGEAAVGYRQANCASAPQFIALKAKDANYIRVRLLI